MGLLLFGLTYILPLIEIRLLFLPPSWDLHSLHLSHKGLVQMTVRGVHHPQMTVVGMTSHAPTHGAHGMNQGKRIPQKRSLVLPGRWPMRMDGPQLGAELSVCVLPWAAAMMTFSCTELFCTLPLGRKNLLHANELKNMLRYREVLWCYQYTENYPDKYMNGFGWISTCDQTCGPW